MRKTRMRVNECLSPLILSGYMIIILTQRMCVYIYTQSVYILYACMSNCVYIKYTYIAYIHMGLCITTRFLAVLQTFFCLSDSASHPPYLHSTRMKACETGFLSQSTWIRVLHMGL